MDVRLDPEQQALREAAASMGARYGPRRVADLADEERVAKFDAALAGSGWRELRSPGDDHRPTASGVEVAVVAEHLGEALADVAYLGPVLAGDLRRRGGAPAATTLETVLLQPDLAAVSGSRTGTAFDARGSSHALSLSSEGQIFRAPLEPPHGGPDLTRPAARPRYTEVEPLPATRLSEDDRTAWTALGLAAACADLVGVMRGAVRLACDYVTQRQQYGVPVGSFQAVQHLLADAHVAVEGSSSICLYAAWAVDALPPGEALVAASVAKAYCARSALSVCEAVIQAHGGIGNTWDCLAHVFLRRALASADLLGGTGPSLDRILSHRLKAARAG